VSTALAAATLALVVPSATSATEPPGCPAADPISNTADGCESAAEPVPTLDPEWSAQFVPPPEPRIRALLPCVPLDAVFYAETDWYRLAQKLRANPSACTSYYVSVPPLANDKTRLRPGEAAKIRALGGQMHAMAEINITGWSSWVAAGNGTWYDAGVEARNRMVAAGFDVDTGDIWAVNEFSSAVRQGTGSARQNMRELVRGLYSGAGTTPVAGLVWMVGIGQPTTFLDTYKGNLKAWLGDGPFWEDMSRYVRFFSQEVYGTATNWAVAGASPQERFQPLADWVEHVAILTSRAPAAIDAVRSYIAGANAPTANAAWPRPGFGWPPATNPAPSDIAAAYVSAQIWALRSQQAPRPSQMWGFAWNPANVSPAIPDIVAKSAVILERLAAAIHDTDAPTAEPGVAACGPELAWCAGDLDGSTFNLAWHVFNTWTQPRAVSPPTATTDEDAQIQVALEAVDPDEGETLAFEIVAQPLHGSAATDGGPTATYTPAGDFNGTDSFTFRVSDGVMWSPPATVTVTVAPVNDAPIVTIDPAGPVDEGAAPIALTAHASDVDGDAVTLAWSTPDGTATFAADDGPATESVSVTADDGNGGVATTSIEIEVRNVAPTADAGSDVPAMWGLPVTLTGAATDESLADAAGLEATWAFGDGSTAPGFDVEHTYDDPGTYVATLTVTDDDGGVDSDTATVTVGPRQATLAYATPAGVDSREPLVGVRLGDATDEHSARLAGHDVTMAIGQSACSATTDSHGYASCTLAGPTTTLGPATLTARFGGDSLYETASTSAPVVRYGMPAGGAFAVGNRSANGSVTFWSPSWWLVNRLSGPPAPASFKGFVEPSGLGWTASPGFARAPASVPEWMGVIVTSGVTKEGAVISGNRPGLVVVHVEAYDPALAGTGLVVATAN